MSRRQFKPRPNSTTLCSYDSYLEKLRVEVTFCVATLYVTMDKLGTPSIFSSSVQLAQHFKRCDDSASACFGGIA